MVLTMLMTALYNALLTVLIYAADKKTAFGKLGYKKKQCITGVLFGAMAIFASTNFAGVDLGDGTIMNVRDAAPLCAGLIFGAPAGIISGLIGGVYRYVSAFFGLTGTYTQLACSVSTIFAGFLAAGVRKLMFDNKKPTWVYGLGIGMFCEVFHMLMIFFTNMDDPSTAFNYVKACTLPMVLCNGLSVCVAIIAISIPHRDRIFRQAEKKHISRTFQFWLFLCVIIAYVVTSSYTYMLQSRISQAETEAVMNLNIDDVYKDIMEASDENLLQKTENIRDEYLQSSDKSAQFLQSLSEKHNVAEVNIVNKDGIIENTNNAEYFGFDMSKGEQSKEFLILLDGTQTSYVQKYQPRSYDKSTSRKYGAVSLPDGGFLQVGYDADEFKADISSYVGKMAKNRHIGNSGFIVICDENWDIVSEGKYFGKNLDDLGISVDTDTESEETLFYINIEKTAYLCEYTFVEGYYIVGVLPKSESQFMRDVSVYLSAFMEILIFAVLFAMVYFLIKKIVIDNLIKVNHSLSKITNGNLDVTVDVRTNEEFASLSDDINSTVSTLKRYIAEAAARIDKELEFAKQIQHSALPSVFPPYPNRTEFDIFAQMHTAKEVGGDFYDFYMLNNSAIAFLIADVSGKGIPAAMFMMRAKTILKDLAESGMEVNDIFTAANEKLCENNDAGMFVTAWMAILNLKTGVMSFANAGHNPPLFRRADGKFEYMKQRSGFVLAGMEGIKYRKYELQLMPGDQIYLYTDGVTEATDTNEQLYGEERLINLLNSLKKTDTVSLCKSVKKDVDLFVGDEPQFDDITMLCLTLNCIKGDDRFLFIPDKNSSAAVSEFADCITAKLNAPTKVSGKINIVIDEIYSNIVNYSKATEAEISYHINGDRLDLKFEDNGIPYNPLKTAEPDITLSAEERKIGGLGIFMVKKIAENIEYSYENNKNILMLTILLS